MQTTSSKLQLLMVIARVVFAINRFDSCPTYQNLSCPMQNQTMPAFYVNHGGGPMPLTMPNEHKGLYESLNAVREAYPNPKAIIMISAHWEEKQFTILDQDNPGLYFDYGGFPPETYKYVYNAKSTKELRSRVVEVAASHGIKLPGKTKRGLDHGVFVPLMIFYPKADIPVIQISLENNMNPQRHYQLGVALSSLRKEGYMVVGSGSSFHNMGAIFGGTGGTTSKGFEQELAKICTKNSTNEQRVKDLLNWKQLKYATECHPREQHLIPLFVVLGAANGQAGTQIPIPMFGMLRLSNYLFQ